MLAEAIWCASLVGYDCFSRRLPNGLTLGGSAAVLLGRWAVGGADSAADGLAGGVLAGAFLLVPFLMRAAGGGDVKMLFAAGCCVGLSGVFPMLVVTSLAGFVFGVGMLLFRRADASRVWHILRCLFDWRYDRAAGRRGLPPRDNEAARVPFSIPIAAGLMLTLLGRWLAGAAGGGS